MNISEQIKKEDLTPCLDCALFNVRKASRVVTQHFDEIMQPSGLRGTQFTILGHIAWFGEATLSELVKPLVMDRTTLTRNLKPLEEQGLVKSLPGKDRRTRTITLTLKGRKTLAKALPLWKKAQTGIIKYLGDNRFDRLLGDLRFIENMSAAK
jgi:DNA-binding MarR family transcriptional regulator